jgi:hypothetical protein
MVRSEALKIQPIRRVAADATPVLAKQIGLGSREKRTTMDQDRAAEVPIHPLVRADGSRER